MAKLSKKVKDEAKIAETEAKVEEVKKEVEEKHMTKEESEALIAQQEAEKEKGASTLKLEKATALLSGKFNLDETYKVTNFQDKGKVLKVTLENKDFVLAVEIKDADRHGLTFDD